MARTYGLEALIIKIKNFGESDRLITFLSKYKGKFTAIAKGVRKVASRRSPNLDLLNHVKAYLAQGKNFDVITEVESLETFKKLKEDLVKVGYGFYLAELINEFLAEGEEHKDIFELLNATLHRLQNEADTEKTKTILRGFELRLLEALGYRPELFVCVKCGNNSLAKQPHFLSPELGGVVESNCRAGNLLTKPLSADALKLLRFLQSEDWAKLKRLSIDASLNKEVEELLRFYIEYLAEKEFASPKFIDQIS